jgi:hypothetical protein
MQPIDEKNDKESDPDSMNLDNSSLRHRISERIKSLPPWIVVTLIALIFLILLCLIPLLVIEVSDQWCNLFSGFFNAITPGICF